MRNQLRGRVKRFCRNEETHTTMTAKSKISQFVGGSPFAYKTFITLHVGQAEFTVSLYLERKSMM
jgi:hypothetical protein